ncbi:MAG: SDR family NAD(P)-dependent oxidoreductase [Clostridiales bacterium]|nr:SDR family NAD(P)-dependent oxidoreductase [Clostridiales bacterium]
MKEKKKTILITGAGGSLGAAAVRAFLEKGYAVFAADVRTDSIPEGAVPVEIDVTSPESVEKAGEEIGKICGRLDAVLHLAGVYTMDSFVEITEEELNRMFEVNLMGVIRVNRVFLPLVRRAGGRIVITASELAPLDPLPFNGIYTVTKRALDGYAHSLALELDLIGVKVVTVYPGAFGDGMTKGAVRALDRMKGKTELYPGVTERFRKIVASETGKAKPPEKLAAFLVKIAEKKRPRFNYFINNSFKLKLFSALPELAQAYLLRKLLKNKE